MGIMGDKLALLVGEPEEEGHEEEVDLKEEVSPELVVAAQEVMDVLSDGGYGLSSPGNSDSKVQKATKEAAREAKAKILAAALKNFFYICDAEPHEEGEHE